jgi:DNA-binding transcriptional LysR family regulator
LTVADLGAYPWASSVEPQAMGKHLNPSRFVCDNYHVLREAVLNTDLVCICTRAFVARELSDGRLQALDVPGFLPARSTVFMATLKGRMLSPLAKLAIQRIAAILAASGNGGAEVTATKARTSRKPSRS